MSQTYGPGLQLSSKIKRSTLSNLSFDSYNYFISSASFNVVSTRSLMGSVVAKKINSIFASIATTIHIVKKIMGIQIISGSKVITFLYIFVDNLYLVVQLDCCSNSERKFFRKTI